MENVFDLGKTSYKAAPPPKEPTFSEHVSIIIETFFDIVKVIILSIPYCVDALVYLIIPRPKKNVAGQVALVLFISLFFFLSIRNKMWLTIPFSIIDNWCWQWNWQTNCITISPWRLQNCNCWHWKRSSTDHSQRNMSDGWQSKGLSCMYFCPCIDTF